MQARKRGVRVTGSEVVGLLPKKSILDAKKLIKNLESEKSKEESDNKLKEESTSGKTAKKLKPEEESTPDQKSKK